MVGNEAGPGHVAHVGCVQDFDFFFKEQCEATEEFKF